jgi:hypothetical protein
MQAAIAEGEAAGLSAGDLEGIKCLGREWQSDEMSMGLGKKR